jgi:hypothetical protein
VGLPHSDIRGSQPAGGSPRLIAAIHVLHRLSVPRHPPCALASSASRSLDLTKPAGSMFSLSLPCSTTLRFFRYERLCRPVASHQKRPDCRRAHQTGARPKVARDLCDWRLRRVTDDPLLLVLTAGRTPTALRAQRSHTISNPHSRVQVRPSDRLQPRVEPRGFEPLTSAVQRRPGSPPESAGTRYSS